MVCLFRLHKENRNIVIQAAKQEVSRGLLDKSSVAEISKETEIPENNERYISFLKENNEDIFNTIEK